MTIKHFGIMVDLSDFYIDGMDVTDNDLLERVSKAIREFAGPDADAEFRCDAEKHGVWKAAWASVRISLTVNGNAIPITPGSDISRCAYWYDSEPDCNGIEPAHVFEIVGKRRAKCSVCGLERLEVQKGRNG